MGQPTNRQILDMMVGRSRTTRGITRELYPNARPWKYNEYRNYIYKRLRRLERDGDVKREKTPSGVIRWRLVE